MKASSKSSKRYEPLFDERQSRIIRTKAYILQHTTVSLMNNRKWQDLFEALGHYSIKFEIKTLLSDQPLTCDWARELAETSILIDDSGNFIEFLEIEKLTFEKSPEILKTLAELKIEYSDNVKIELYGYRK